MRNIVLTGIGLLAAFFFCSLSSTCLDDFNYQWNLSQINYANDLEFCDSGNYYNPSNGNDVTECWKEARDLRTGHQNYAIQTYNCCAFSEC